MQVTRTVTANVLNVILLSNVIHLQVTSDFHFRWRRLWKLLKPSRLWGAGLSSGFSRHNCCQVVHSSKRMWCVAVAVKSPHAARCEFTSNMQMVMDCALICIVYATRTTPRAISGLVILCDVNMLLYIYCPPRLLQELCLLCASLSLSVSVLVSLSL